MIKTIALAALGTLIAATPALAGPGLVFQGTSLNGIKLQGIAADGLALHTEPRRAPVAAPVVVPPIDAELAGAPKPTKCVGCGVKFNGISWNGLTWNGWSLNGIKLNSVKLNGNRFNGTATGAVEAIDAGFTVGTVTLPGGARIVIAG